MTAASSNVLAALHGILNELALGQRDGLDTTAESILRGAPAALWASYNGDPRDAVAIDVYASGGPQGFPTPDHRTIAVSPAAGAVQRSLGILDAMVSEICNGGELLRTRVSTTNNLAMTAESMLSPLLLTLHGSPHAHRVEYALLAAAEASRIPAAWVDVELLSWGREPGHVLADFNLGRLMGWIRSGRLINAGVSDELSASEISSVHLYGGDLYTRPVAWFGSRASILDDLGLIVDLSPAERETLLALHRDGWDGTVAELIAAACAL